MTDIPQRDGEAIELQNSPPKEYNPNVGTPSGSPSSPADTFVPGSYEHWDCDDMALAFKVIEEHKEKLNSFLNLARDDPFPNDEMVKTFRYLAGGIFIDYYSYCDAWYWEREFRTAKEYVIDRSIAEHYKQEIVAILKLSHDCAEYLNSLLIFKAFMGPPNRSNYAVVGVTQGEEKVEELWKKHTASWAKQLELRQSRKAEKEAARREGLRDRTKKRKVGN